MGDKHWPLGGADLLALIDAELAQLRGMKVMGASLARVHAGYEAALVAMREIAEEHREIVRGINRGFCNTCDAAAGECDTLRSVLSWAEKVKANG